jgi:hypothetical protein
MSLKSLRTLKTLRTFEKPYKMKTQKETAKDNADDEKKEVSLEDTMDISDYDVEISEEDFFDELDEGIDNYFQNLRKKK